ncbi:hypothetical protein NDU88_005813 [Pleurodeles waltl]|uniref:Uncharacterized protein n=1 Tax=Pleurodeles waltl TaxID=8319 RepID=A0AAV7UN64_PLEWA|nr:hypothetical protein NDU88_005813 [Pleurodeles waltl]
MQETLCESQTAKSAVCDSQMRVSNAEMHFASRDRLAKCISESQIGRGVPFLFAIRSGTLANVSREEVPALSSPPNEEAHSDDSNSGLQDLDDLPCPLGILVNVQKKRLLQEAQYQGIREDLQALNNTLISIAGVLTDSHHRAPATRQTSEQPSTSAAASGQEAPPQDEQATSTPLPAEREPTRKRSL